MIHLTGRAAKGFFLSALAVLMLSVSSMAAESDIAVGVGATTGSSLRLRAEASTSSAVLTTLDKNLAVAILDQSVEGWYKVSYNGTVGFVSADYVTIDQDNVFETYGRVLSNAVNVRSGASTDTSIVASVNTNDVVTVKGFADGWYKVTCESGTEGYIRSDFIALTNSKTISVTTTSNSANGILTSAAKHLGTRYVWGGASPSGFDCSGFTMYVYKQLGYSLPHSASAQWQSGIGTKVTSMNDLQPGDLVFFRDPSRANGKACSHVGIYAGNGQMIHSSSSKSCGVIYSNLNNGYYNKYFVGGLHV